MDSYEVLTAPADFSAVREALEQAGVPMLEAQVAMVPQTYVELTDEKDIKNLQRLWISSMRTMTSQTSGRTGTNDLREYV